jgi:hypothetical protein
LGIFALESSSQFSARRLPATTRVFARHFEFRLSEIFSFSGGAKFGEFRPGAWLQASSRQSVSEWR